MSFESITCIAFSGKNSPSKLGSKATPPMWTASGRTFPAGLTKAKTSWTEASRSTDHQCLQSGRSRKGIGATEPASSESGGHARIAGTRRLCAHLSQYPGTPLRRGPCFRACFVRRSGSELTPRSRHWIALDRPDPHAGSAGGWSRTHKKPGTGPGSMSLRGSSACRGSVRKFV